MHVIQYINNLISSHFCAAGGFSHTDVQGIHYARDPLTDEDIGTASDFGMNLIIARVPPADQVIKDFFLLISCISIYLNILMHFYNCCPNSPTHSS